MLHVHSYAYAILYNYTKGSPSRFPTDAFTTSFLYIIIKEVKEVQKDEYKVQVGAYPKKESAKAQAAKLKAAGFNCLVTTNSSSRSAR